MTEKERIIEIFRNQIKGIKPDVSTANIKHDGKLGHWLESKFGINHNASNSADIWGFELKNETGSKTTFGDWSANEYIFDDPKFFYVFTEQQHLPNLKKYSNIDSITPLQCTSYNAGW